MDVSILSFTAVLPIVLILVYVYSKDREKEPLFLLLQLFCLGLVSCYITLVISDLFDIPFGFINEGVKNNDLLSIFIRSFIKVALVEEFCKWIMVFFRGYNNKEFDDKYDIIVYSVFVSLGFAFFENIVYVFNDTQLKTMIVRGLLSVPSHTCDAIFMGYFLSIAKHYQLFKDNIREKIYLLLSILVPTTLHGIFDFCIFTKITILYFALGLFVTGLFILSYKKLQDVSSDSEKVNDNQKRMFCGKCGSVLVEGKCIKCRKNQ